ncbi:MAG: hypothetical protein C0412_11525 [Flavobacterium sp.]|nr:hypothetical protein [Flavobacterium sp.]
MEFDLVVKLQSCSEILQLNKQDGLVGFIYYSHIPTAAVSLLLGLFVFLKNKKDISAKLLLLISMFFATWSFFDIILWTSVDSRKTMFFWSLISLAENLVTVSALYFAYVFLEKRDVSSKIKIFFMTLFLPYLFLMPTAYNMPGFNVTLCEAEQGKLINYFYFLEILFFLILAGYVSKKIIQTKSEDKKQVVYFSIGIILFLASFSGANIAGSVAAILNPENPDNWKILQYGLFGMPVFMGFLAYLIVKFKAFNIKLLGAQALVISLVGMVAAEFFFTPLDNTTNIILISVTVLLSAIFGMFLINSVQKEAQRKEELQQMSDSLSLANDKLRQLDQAKNDFVSMASHQLRRSPTSIKGFISLILEGSYGEISPEIKDILEKVYKSNEVQIAFVEDLLNVSRLESGSVKFEFAPAKVEELCQDTVDALSLKAKDGGLYLDYKKPEKPLPELMMDKSKIREVISNLVDNAIKYTKKGGVTLAVELCRKKQSNCLSVEHIRLTVSDTGIGIPATEIPYLFSKFSRGKDISRLNANGTGLGLYLVKMMIGGNGGKVWVESEGDGKGSRFIMELPLEQSKEAL